MNTTYTPEALKKLLIEHDDGVLKSGGHAAGRDFCAMEFLAKIAGEPWTDKPQCVHPTLGAYCRGMNDATWPSDGNRTETMLPLLAEVFGTNNLNIDARRIAEQTIRVIVPIALEAAAELHHDEIHKAVLRAAAERCRVEGSYAACNAASAACNAASDAASDAAISANDAASNAAISASFAARAARAASDAASDAASAASAACDAASDAASAASAACNAASDAASDAARVEVYKQSIAIVIAEIKRAKAAV